MAKKKVVKSEEVKTTDIIFLDRDYNNIASLCLAGYSVEEIAKNFGLGVNEFRDNYIKKNDRLRQTIESNYKFVEGECVENLRKLASGFYVEIKEWSVSLLNVDGAVEHRNDLIKALEKEDYSKFFELVRECMILNELDKNGALNIKEKYYPPDFRANEKLLGVVNPLSWDSESKKKIPQKTTINIILGKEGSPKPRFVDEGYRKLDDSINTEIKEVDANFEIIS